MQQLLNWVERLKQRRLWAHEEGEFREENVGWQNSSVVCTGLRSQSRRSASHIIQTPSLPQTHWSHSFTCPTGSIDWLIGSKDFQTKFSHKFVISLCYTSLMGLIEVGIWCYNSWLTWLNRPSYSSFFLFCIVPMVETLIGWSTSIACDWFVLCTWVFVI